MLIINGHSEEVSDTLDYIGSFDSLIFNASTARSLLFKDKVTDRDVQFMNFKFYENPKQIFDTFDFTCCMGAFDVAKDEFVLHNDFILHNAQRKLVFNSGTAFPIMSLFRIDKYKGKGYSITQTELLKLTMTCMNLKISSWNELKDQISGLYGYRTDGIFNEDVDFSLETAIDQIGTMMLYDFKVPSKEGNDFGNVIQILSNHCFGKDVQFSDKYYYKCVDSNHKSIYNHSGVVDYSVIGSIINGGPNGIYIHRDPNDPYNSYRNWVELELINGGVEDGSGGLSCSSQEAILIGDVRVVRHFENPDTHINCAIEKIMEMNI